VKPTPLFALAWMLLGPAPGLQAADPAPRALPELPGQRADGSVLLPNQWSLRPIGKQINVGDFPVNIALHPGGRHAAVLHSGYGPHEVVIVDVRSAKVVSRVALEESFYGITFSRDGSDLYCSGAGDEVIRAFSFRKGLLGDPRELRVRPVAKRGAPSGLALSADGSTLWIANVWGHEVSRIRTDGSEDPVHLRLGDAPAATASGVVAPPENPDLAAATKRGEALLDPTSSADPFPYSCVLDEPRNRLYVSLWAHSAVAVVDTTNLTVVARWKTEEHPNELLIAPSGRHLYVANANRNTVSVFDLDTGKSVETLFAALHPQAPAGSTPNSLALTPDGSTLFVANACNNNVAVFDVREPGRSRSLGFIPVGWYPTSVRVTPDGKRLVVANGKGQISKPNRHGPRPGKDAPARNVLEHIGGLMQGTVSVIDLPDREDLPGKLKPWTVQAYQCSPLQADTTTSRGRPEGNPIPARVGDPSPIRHVLYIIKENRTYDQVLGDMPQGNGDPSLCLFPEDITPNHHALAREFVLLDNFYVESEVSADGHEWTLGAVATDFVEKTWPLNYGHNARGKFPYPSEGRFPVAMPSAGYLWDAAKRAGITYRSYGSFVENGKTPADPATTRVATLVDHIDPGYRGWDMDYPDVQRAERFLSELKRFEQTGDMPRLQILRLPNDHTYGTSVGKPSPRAMVADNDLALGRIIEGLSRSKFWPTTAVFVVEDDAQNGPDHVDAHRTIAYAISPYVRRGTVDSSMYSTCSMLRTLELILGLQPMTQFDAAAKPMYASFQAQPDLRPYDLRPVTADRSEKNLASAWGAAESGGMNFSKEDAADDLRLNEVVWRSIRGSDHPMPGPVRAAFVFAAGDGDEDEDDD
jgi:DNA-binding beta-propeller fold protein YncE